jgi:hypothetical protein
MLPLVFPFAGSVALIQPARRNDAGINAAPVVLLLLAALLAGCSSKQLYASGQQWQRSECRKIEDRDERMRCEQGADRSYESYQAQTEAARKP